MVGLIADELFEVDEGLFVGDCFGVEVGLGDGDGELLGVGV